MPHHDLETAFSIDTSAIKFGPGVTREAGYEVARLGARRVAVVTDPRMAQLEPVAVVLDSLRAEGIDAILFDQVEVEPTDESFKAAIEFATEGNFDAFVSVGGGSSIDTAKAANLYSTHPADFFTYVNAPIGQGTPVPGPLKPHVAIPTTSGTGSETTGVAIFDLLEMKAKTGLAHRALRPTVGIVDPRQQPHASRNGNGVQRIRRALPRTGVLHRDAVQPTGGTGQPGTSALVPGIEPDQRRLGRPRNRDGLAQHRQRR